ncbi:MAG: MFS transporter, partial [Alphaproteobacteria bacterium]
DIVGNLPFMRLVNPEERTEMSVVFYTWRDVSFALTPLFGAIIITLGGIEAVFIALGAIFCMMTGLTFALPRIIMSNDARPAV